MQIEQILMKLCSADAVAGGEGEIRNITREFMKPLADEVMTDGIGSLVFHMHSTNENPVKILFCAHMDEVGFLVRHISPIGMVYAHPVGNPLAKSQDMQQVRITTASGKKIRGVMNTTRDMTGQVEDVYVDLGVDSEEAVRSLGVSEGDMICWATEPYQLSEGVVSGKAMDDRAGITALAQAMESIRAMGTPTNDLYFAVTSSEEVGTRGGKLCCELVQPDLVVAVDVANHSELDRGFKNHRHLGAGLMLELYDKTMSPNRALLNWVRNNLEAVDVPYQSDMFGGGGTDAGLAHMVGTGCLALVLGIPIRYCHSSISLASIADIKATARAVTSIATRLAVRDIASFTDFIHR